MSQLELITAVFLFLGLYFKNYRPIVAAVITWMLTVLSFLILSLLLMYCIYDPKSFIAVHLFVIVAYFSINLLIQRQEMPHGWSSLFLTDHTALRMGFALLAVLDLIPVALCIWFCNIGGRCYQYLRDHEEYCKAHGDKEVQLGGSRPDN